jgi:hypothetical protein
MTTTAVLTGSHNGQTWELVRRALVQPYSLGERYSYLVRIDGQERWAAQDGDLDTAIRELDNPDQLAHERQVRADRQARADAEQRAVDELRVGRAARAAECEQTGTPVHVRFGYARPGTASTNHRDGSSEAGLSVYAGWRMPDGQIVLDLRGVDTTSFLFGGFTSRPAYLATGTETGRGADGEPLLIRHRLRKLGQIEVEYVA